jgi:hypothetical protein
MWQWTSVPPWFEKNLVKDNVYSSIEMCDSVPPQFKYNYSRDNVYSRNKMCDSVPVYRHNLNRTIPEAMCTSVVLKCVTVYQCTTLISMCSVVLSCVTVYLCTAVPQQSKYNYFGDNLYRSTKMCNRVPVYHHDLNRTWPETMCTLWLRFVTVYQCTTMI